MTTLFVSCALLIGQAGSIGIPEGASKFEVEHGDARIDVFAYRPAAFQDGPLLIVFHGADRNAEEYRDHAKELGDRQGMLVLAPCFDRARFNGQRYHRGGLIRDGQVAPRAEWTWEFIPKLVAEVRRREGRPGMEYYLLGHSAGGQFLARMAGFVKTEAKRVVVVNPSAYLYPSLDEAFPYGFGKLPEDLSNEARLKSYLAQPVTIYLGALDTERDPSLDKCPEADRQGLSRYQRGRNVYQAAEQLAKQKGWDFAWQLVETPDAGHDHEKMFNSPACARALFGVPTVAVNSTLKAN